MKKIFLLLFLLSVAIQAQSAFGIVFNDENKNGKMDNGEEGIEDVLVSSESKIVKTNGDGEFSLSYDKRDVIFVIKPADYATPLDENNVPQFFHIHNPEGSDTLKFKGIAATGNMPDTLFFPLYESESAEDFTFFAFGDPQPRDSAEIDYMKSDVISEITNNTEVMAIALGDIMYNDLSLYERYNEVMSELNIPIYNVPGNHDIDFDSQLDEGAFDTFKQHYGPAYYSFNYGKVHFVVLEDIKYSGNQETHRYTGEFGEEQLNWVKQDLEFVPEDNLIIFTKHIPVINSWSNKKWVADADKLFDLVSDRKHTLFLSGHAHILENDYVAPSDTLWKGKDDLHHIICGALCGSWWLGPKDERGIPIADMRDGVPNGYFKLTIKGNKYSTFYKPSRFDKDFQVRISYPTEKVEAGELDTNKVVINVFNGNKKWNVEYSFDEGEYKSAEKYFGVDPYIDKVIKDNMDDFWKNFRALPTHHLWQAEFPELKKGIHTVKVKATDPQGNEYVTSQIFDIK